jgi:uncharacterized protein YegL
MTCEASDHRPTPEGTPESPKSGFIELYERGRHVNHPPPPPGYPGSPTNHPNAVVPSAIPEYSYRVLPFTLVVDTSGSMEGQPIAAINEELPRIHAAVASEPMLADVAHISVVSFSTRAETVLPLSDLSDVARMPVLAAGGWTNYREAFRHLRSKLQADHDRLRSEGRKAYRPTVFFLSDGQPSRDDWESEYSGLTGRDFSLRPNILAFGFGEANEGVIRRVGNVAAYMAETDGGPVTCLQGFIEVFLSSVLDSASQVVAGAPSALALPTTVDGWRSIPLDEVD